VNEHDIIIIGCGAGGGTAAQFARKMDRKAQITIFEKGTYPQYSKCGLPYVISKKIPSPSELIEFNEDWFKKARIDLHLGVNVQGIDTKDQIITAQGSDGTIVKKHYTSLIIATGAYPSIPPIKNIVVDHRFLNGVLSLRTLDDTKYIEPFIDKGGNATVIGAGLIGMEMADCLHKREMNVTVVEALPSILANTLDQEMSSPVEEHIKDYITLYTNHFALKVQANGKTIGSLIIQNRATNETKVIPTDLLVIATGTKPEVSLAEQAGCNIGVTGCIKVDAKSQTSQKNIYAVGDCTEFIDYVTKRPVRIGLGSIAVRQAIAAGINASGGEYQLPDGVLQTCTSEFFGIEIAAVGPSNTSLSETELITGKYMGSSLPTYFPNGQPITLKTLIDAQTGRILAAQAVGDKSAQRINTYATAILAGLTIDTFRKLETAYAPPIAPTLDVVTLAADIAAMKQERRHGR